MKLGTFLLAVFVLLLSVKSIAQPLAETVLTDACCTEEVATDSTAHEEDCGGCDEHCSPFQPCCPYTAIPAIAFGLTIPRTTFLVAKDYPAYKYAIHNNYSSDFWQPPRTV